MAANKNGSTSVSAPAAVVAGAAGTVQSAIGSVSARLTEIDTQMANLTAERQGILDSVRAIGGTVEVAPVAAPSRRGRPAGSRNKAKAGAKVKRGTNARSQNEKTLGVHIVEALVASPNAMSPTQITDAVTAAGYKTNSDNLTTMIGGQLQRLSRTSFGKDAVISYDGRAAWSAGTKRATTAFLADPRGGTVSK